MFTIDEMRKRAKNLLCIVRNLNDVTISDDEVRKTKNTTYYYQGMYQGKREFGHEAGKILIVFMKDKTISEFVYDFSPRTPEEVTFIEP